LEELKVNRRTFYLICIYVVWTMIGLVLAIPAAVYLLWPPRPKKEPGWTEAGTVTELNVGPPSELVFRKNRVDGWKVTSEKSTAWGVRKAENEIVAFSPQCPHLGCAVHWVAKKNEISLSLPCFHFFHRRRSSNRSCWHQVFGSVAVFLFQVQAFTGLLLAFNYAPTPGDAL
jgi:Rieske Fe-S protein